MVDEERKVKQAQAIEERKAEGKSKPLLIRDHKMCQGYGYGMAIGKFETEVDGAVMISVFCSLNGEGEDADKS